MAKLRYVSLFSGVEAVSCALDHDVWEPVAFSEIDPFPCAVLQHHYPNVPNLGDITKIDWTPYVDTIDVVWGGSPCQSFSLAGDRSGLKGASGLMFEFVRAVRELRPRWFVWENVPGALSSENGNAFRQLLQSMDEGGYGLAWRVLDAQFFGVAQRRERVFLVGSLGTMRCADVLFEREGMPWDYSPSRDKRKALAHRIEDGVGQADHGVSPTLKQSHNPAIMCRADTQANSPEEPDMAPTLSAHASHDAPYIYRKAQTPQIRSGKDGGGKGALVQDDLSATLGTHNSQTLSDVADGSMTVRRLTPTECERLQGFPDGWTDIPYKGNEHPPDGPRYKALGNSMAVPVMRRIGERIITFDEGSKSKWVGDAGDTPSCPTGSSRTRRYARR